MCLAAHGPVDRQADLQRHPEALQPVSRQRQPEDQRQTVLRQGGGSLPQRLMWVGGVRFSQSLKLVFDVSYDANSFLATFSNKTCIRPANELPWKEIKSALVLLGHNVSPLWHHKGSLYLTVISSWLVATPSTTLLFSNWTSLFLSSFKTCGDPQVLASGCKKSANPVHNVNVLIQFTIQFTAICSELDCEPCAATPRESEMVCTYVSFREPPPVSVQLDWTDGWAQWN